MVYILSQRNETKIKDSDKIVAYPASSALSWCVAFVSVLNAFMRFNNTNIKNFYMHDINFLFLILPLFLASCELLSSYRRYKCNGLTRIMKIFAVASIALSGFTIFVYVAISCKLLAENVETIPKCIVFNGNLGNFYNMLKIGNFKSAYFIYIYFFSAIFQCVANIVKIFVNNDLKNNIKEKEGNS